MHGRRYCFTISNKWHHPAIYHRIDAFDKEDPEKGLDTIIDLEDAIKILLAEYGHPIKVLTPEQHEKKLRAAFAALIKGVNDETCKVM